MGFIAFIRILGMFFDNYTQIINRANYKFAEFLLSKINRLTL